MLSPFSRSLKSDRCQMLGALDQQCCVRLHGALVYLSSLKDFKNLFGLKKIVFTPINAARSCEIAT